MTPALPAWDAAKEIRREMERTRLRAQKGIALLTRGEPPKVAPTPRDQVWAQGKARLWRYRGGEPRYQPPLILFLGLVGRPYVLDLYAGNSIVETLIYEGFDVFLLDWGIPDAAEGDHTLDTYVDEYLPRAIAAAQRVSDSPDVTLVPYCMGASLALLLLGSRDDIRARNLVLLTPPCDWSQGPGAAQLVREGRIVPEELVDQTSGIVPTSVLRAFFKLRKPTSDVVQYVTLWENLWRDDFAERHRAMSQWVWDLVPMAGPAFIQYCQEHVRDNGMMTGQLRVRGRPVSLKKISQPTLIILADRDDLVPPACSAPLAGRLGTEDVEIVGVPAGHTGAFMGRSSKTVTVPALVGWLMRHSTAASPSVSEQRQA
jgi:polyhydroxyalkanoate synthase subunit PhaC